MMKRVEFAKKNQNYHDTSVEERREKALLSLLNSRLRSSYFFSIRTTGGVDSLDNMYQYATKN